MRKATERDLQGILAAGVLEALGRDDRGRTVLRAMPADAREELHALASDERERRAAGDTITD